MQFYTLFSMLLLPTVRSEMDPTYPIAKVKDTLVSAKLTPSILFAPSSSRSQWWSQEPPRTLENDATVFSLSFHPNGKTIASTSDKTITLWYLNSGEVTSKQLTGHTDLVYSVDFNQDGTKLVSGSFDETARIWSVDSGENISVLEEHSKMVTSVTFSPDGQLVASGSGDETVRVWKVEDPSKSILVLSGHSGGIESVCFHPEGNVLASFSYDNDIKLWKVNNGEELGTLSGPSWVMAMAFSPDGTKLASGSEDRSIIIWDWNNGNILSTLEGHSDVVYSVKFSPNGQHVVSGSSDKTVRIWNLENEEPIKILEGHSNQVYSVAYSPNGQMIASGSDDNTIKLWISECPECSAGPSVNPFSIGAAVSTLDDWSASKKLQINHKIGNGPGKVTVQLYSKDCSATIPSLKLVSLSGDNFAASSLKYEIGIDFSKLSSSDYVVFDNGTKSQGTVFFCTHIQTYLESNNDEVGELYLSSMKTNFQVKFDLTNIAFEVSDIGVSSEAISDSDGETLDTQFTITACVCDAETAVCATSPEAIAMNSRVDLCLRPSSDEVEIVNFSLTLKNGGVTYNPITIGASGFKIDDEVLTEVTPVSNNLVIDQFLIAGLFSGNSNIILTGVANLNFVSGEVRTFSTFEMNLDIIIDQDDSVGCLNTVLQGLMRLLK